MRMLTILALAALAAGAERPSFSGTWVMDAGKSSFGRMPPPSSMIRKVEQTGFLLTVIDEQDGGPQGRLTLTRNYSTDGRATVNPWMGVDMKTTAAWDGSTLVITSKAELQGAEVRLTSRWSLSEAGKVLTDAVHLVAPQGELYVTYVLNKQ